MVPEHPLVKEQFGAGLGGGGRITGTTWLEGCIWGGGGGAEFKQLWRWRIYRIEESAHREVDHKDGMLRQCGGNVW